MTLSIFDQFYNIGIIPVLEIDSVDHAVPLAESLIAGGLPMMEVGRLFVYFVSFVVKEF